jgi:EAL domain-containing protein (putative c-di-GMP-specific phosphodiesterase class I)
MANLVREIALEMLEGEVGERIAPFVGTERPPLVVVVKSFLKDEEWVDYLAYIIDADGMKGDFAKVLGRSFDVVYVGITHGIDLFAVVVPKKRLTPDGLEDEIEVLEDDLIALFLSDGYIGRIKRQVDVFQNPFKSFMEFAVGYSLIKSGGIDDITVAVKMALARADIRRRKKLDDLSLELFRILDEEDVHSVFQPIVDIKERKIYAHEALLRGPEGSPLRSPELLFRVAHLNRVEMDLDRLARRHHLKVFRSYLDTHPGARLTVNLGPFMPMFLEDVMKDMEMFRVPRDSVIWEVSERTYIDDFPAFARTIDFLVSQGYKVAVDDFGAGATTFKMIYSIDAQIIKIDRSFVEDVDRAPEKREFLERLIGCFYRPDNLIFIEGVERTEEVLTLLEIGYRFYQGYRFFRPMPNPVDDAELTTALAGIDYTLEQMQFTKFFTD